MNSSKETYKVIFSGSILAGFERKTVAKHFAKIFKLNDKKALSRVFSGKTITLKRGLNYEDARRYDRALNRIGADCCLEREQRVLYGVPEFDHDYERKKRNLVKRYSQPLGKIELSPKTEIFS